MRSKLVLSFLALSGLGLLPAASFAANANAAAQGEDKSEKVRKVTGCLAKEGDDYMLTADNGAMWELKGDTVNLSDQDRKSTRLNSSHLVISYAVFCLKKNT